MQLRSPRQQLDLFANLMEGRQLERSSPTFDAALKFMNTFPGELSKGELNAFREKVCVCWNVSPTELDEYLSKTETGVDVKNARYTNADLRKAQEDEDEFLSLVPHKGFFHDYIEYTKESEAPVVYHFFTAIIGLAAIINRRCGFNMGPTGKIYPPLGVILIGPSGIKKTSSADIMVSILTDTTLVPLYSEKVTPEALVEGMSKGQAVGLVYAPEMAVFLNKSSYNEGLVPLLTRLMDSPDKWESKTISRGTTILSNIALSSLMCSTSDWFISNTPADMFGGGFIARNLIIHQTISPRIIPIPRARDETLRTRVLHELTDLHRFQGEMFFSPRGEEAYVDFYHHNKMAKPEHDMLEAYHQRKPAHAIRLAMLLHISTHRDMEICYECFERALAILSWTEKFMPSLLRQMFRTGVGEDAEKILRVIRSNGGVIPHSVLIRKMQYTMNAPQVKVVVTSLKESGQIEEIHTKFAHTYTLKESHE